MTLQLNKLLEIRRIREEKARHTLNKQRIQLSECLSQRQALKERYEAFCQWRVRHESELLQQLQTLPVTLDRLLQYRKEIKGLADEEMRQMGEINAIDQLLETRQQALRKIQRQHHEATKAREKLKEIIANQSETYQKRENLQEHLENDESARVAFTLRPPLF